MVASKVIHILSLKRGKALMVKIDFQKAFDSISWDYLSIVIQKMGFNKVWTIWIKKSLTTAQI